MVKVTFIRHGQSIYNKWRHWGDQEDCGLTSEGKRQAAKLEGTYDLLLVSPMKRCLETLYQSNIGALNVYVTKWVREYRKNNCDFKMNESRKVETEEELLHRIAIFKKKLLKLKEKTPRLRTICVLSHADFIWYFSSYLKDGERFGQWLGNCESWEWEF